MSKHLERLEREIGIPGLTELLTERLSPTDLQSLMLEVYRRSSSKLKPAEVLRRYRESRFCRVSPIAPEKMAKAHLHVYKNLGRDFEFIQLSPLAPLGSCAAVATCDQNKIVSTIRNLEVASDSTNVLALEAALRRKKAPVVHLGALQRVVRAQAMEGEEIYAHFGLLGLLSSGLKGRNFLPLHLSALVKMLSDFPGELGDIEVRLTPLDRRGEAELEQLGDQLSGCSWRVDSERQTGRGYYHKLCYKIYAGGLEMGDGGYTDWTAKLTSNRKEQCVISGLGLERLAARID